MTDDKILMEKKALLEKAAKQCFEAIEDNINDLRALGTQSIHEDYDSLHKRLISISSIETNLARVFEGLAKLKFQVDALKARAKAELEDKEMESMEKPQFKNALSTYTTRPEVEAKLRSLAIREVRELRVWSELSLEVNMLSEILRNYQQDAQRARRDIDTRLKILSMRF